MGAARQGGRGCREGMNAERTFINVDDAVLIHLIQAAQRKIVFVAMHWPRDSKPLLSWRLRSSWTLTPRSAVWDTATLTA